MIRIYKGIFFLLINLVLLNVTKLLAQQDCSSAVPLCSPIVSNIPAHSGTGLYPDEISSCIAGQPLAEYKSRWYVFTAQETGNFGFTITSDPDSDLDWAVYDMTNANCADIKTNSAIKLACNVASSLGPTGPNGGSSEREEPLIPVVKGNVYMIYVSNRQDQTYKIDASSYSQFISDKYFPKIESIVTPPTCGGNKLTIKFSEPIRCPNSTDFVSVNNKCGTGNVLGYDDQFIYTLPQPIEMGGNYTFSIKTPLQDICGLKFDNDQSIGYSVSGIATNVNVTDATCSNNNGQVNITASNGLANYTMSILQAGQTIATQNNIATAANFNNLAPGVYTLQTLDAGGCKKNDDITINATNPFNITSTTVADTCMSQNGQIILNIQGGTKPYTINSAASFVFDANDTSKATAKKQQGNQTVLITVSDSGNNCHKTITANVPNTNNEKLKADFSYTNTNLTPDKNLNPTFQFTDLSKEAVQWHWIFENSQSNDKNPTATIYTNATNQITLQVTDKYGCTASTSKTIVLESPFFISIPNAFSPNDDGLNDYFLPKYEHIGVDYKFKLDIFDRFGQIIKTQIIDDKEGWDGTDNKNNKLPTGVYVYKLEIISSSSTTNIENIGKIYTGKINLIK